jgi:hypothetical protein
MRFTKNIYTFEWGYENWYGNKTQLNEALREWKRQDLGDEPDYQTLELVQVNKNGTAIYKQCIYSRRAGDVSNWILFDGEYFKIASWDNMPDDNKKPDWVALFQNIENWWPVK